MGKRSAIVVGFLIASVIPAIELALLSLMSEARVHSMTFLDAFLLVAVSFLVFYPYSILFAAVIGVPLFFACRRLGVVTWWSALVCGALIGTLASAAFHSARDPYIDDLLRFVPVGSIAAYAFWLVWRRAAGAATR